jgi:putative hydrolase of the HAD superfamily
VIRGVIFDLGSTLIRFDGDWDLAVEEGLQALTRQMTADGWDVDSGALRSAFRREMEAAQRIRQKDHVEQTTGSVLRRALETLGVPAVDDGPIQRALAALYAVSEERWHPMPGLHPMLEALRAGGYRLGLISNAGDEANVLRLLAAAGLGGAFEPQLISAAEGVRKPNVSLFQRILSAWDLPPGEAVMVGDTLGEDILGAQSAGLHSIWFTADADTPGNRALMGRLHPEASTDSLLALPGVIRSLDGAVRPPR